MIFASNWIQAAYDVFFLGGYENAMDHIYAAGVWLTEIYGALGPGEIPGYCYRAWYQTTPQSVAPKDDFWPQDFPGISIYYEFFGNANVLNVLQRANEVWWEGGGLGFAAVVAFALENAKPDHKPPEKITDIYFDQDPATGNIRLQWRNVADADRIQIKYTTEEGPIKDLHTFNDSEGIAYWEMQHVTGESAPLGEGEWQTMLLNLPGDVTNYRFVMKSWDAYNNVSEISNVGLITSVEQIPDNVPKEFRLEQNYPNPFNPSTTIQFALPMRSEVMLRVFDILGKEVETLVDEELQPGEHKVVFKVEELPSGVYYYRLRVESYVSTKKLILLR